MTVYRTITFTDMSPGGGLEVGVKYPIIKVDGIDTIVDSEGRYHSELPDSRFLDACRPIYTVEFSDEY